MWEFTLEETDSDFPSLGRHRPPASLCLGVGPCGISLGHIGMSAGVTTIPIFVQATILLSVHGCRFSCIDNTVSQQISWCPDSEFLAFFHYVSWALGCIGNSSVGGWVSQSLLFSAYCRLWISAEERCFLDEGWGWYLSVGKCLEYSLGLYWFRKMIAEPSPLGGGISSPALAWNLLFLWGKFFSLFQESLKHMMCLIDSPRLLFLFELNLIFYTYTSLA